MKLNLHSQDSEWLSRCEDFEQSVLKYKSVRFSHFVRPHDLAVFKSQYRLSPDVKCRAYGGSDDAERVVLGFYPDFSEIEDKDFPVVPLLISNLNSVTHRDVLGSVLGLGIKREMIGDIYFDDGSAVVMCEEKTAEYVLYNLKTVGRQKVDVTVYNGENTFSLVHKFEILKIIVSSKRLDAVLAQICRMSRSEATKHILSENVNVNFTVETNPDKNVTDGDVISVRHYGRFMITETTGKTRKGRITLEVKKYI